MNNATPSYIHEAQFYHSTSTGKIECRLCPKHCQFDDNSLGFCKTRKRIGDRLVSLNYGLCGGGHLDPIEKKPLRRFLPGSFIFSVGSIGCNFSCAFCQNHDFVEGQHPLMSLTPDDLVTQALQLGPKNIGIAYTYSEPTVWYEFIYDTARLARQNGLKNVVVTNGYIERAPLAKLLPFIDALNIDVKAFHEDFYRQICQGGLENVKETVRLSTQHAHVEITTLIIPGLNDSTQEIAKLAEWLSQLSPQIPLHLTRYFPCHHLAIPPTPLATLKQLQEIAAQYLQYVYLGNV